jgi:enoyl-CoA hydratase
MNKDDSFPDLMIERHGRVALLTLNRPQVLNALATDLLGQLSEALAGLDADNSVRVIVLTGSLKAFAAGADINELSKKTGEYARTEDPRQGYWKTIRNVEKPVIAAVNGFCLGGGNELAMTCDFIVCGRGARFGQPEVNLAVMPGAGGTQRLTALAGKGKAMRWLLTGEMIDADEALSIGLVTEVCEPEFCVTRSLEIAQMIADRSVKAVTLIKKSVLESNLASLNRGLEHEFEAFCELLSSPDKAEGIQAFLEKRKAVF